MKLLVQIGSAGDSVIDHLIRPISRADSTERIMVVSRRPGPEIPKTEYHTPPPIVASSALLAFLYESFILLRLSIVEKPGCLIGCLLFPHALLAFIVARLTGRALIVALIAGPVELYTIGVSTRKDFNKPIPMIGKFFLRILTRSDAVVTTGSFTRDFLVRNGMEAERIHPIIHTPDSSDYYPMNIQKEYDALFVGRLAQVKHAEAFLQAISRAKETKKDIRACVVGDGPCRMDLIRLTAALDINDNVAFVGFQRDVTHYYNASRVLVLTSEREGFPNVLLEAMMCGIPSVITNCGDVMDLARDGYNCIVVSRFDDYSGIAEGITRLLQDDTLYTLMSQNALKTVSGSSIEEAVRKWELVLNGLSQGLGGPGNS